MLCLKGLFAKASGVHALLNDQHSEISIIIQLKLDCDDCDRDDSQRHTDSPLQDSLEGEVKSPLSQIIDCQPCTEEVMTITIKSN